MKRIIKEIISRGSEFAPCFCGKMATTPLEFQEATEEEIKAYNLCPCCCEVYKCDYCGEEFIAEWDAPEAWSD